MPRPDRLAGSGARAGYPGRGDVGRGLRVPGRGERLILSFQRVPKSKSVKNACISTSRSSSSTRQRMLRFAGRSWNDHERTLDDARWRTLKDSEGNESTSSCPTSSVPRTCTAPIDASLRPFPRPWRDLHGAAFVLPAVRSRPADAVVGPQRSRRAGVQLLASVNDTYLIWTESSVAFPTATTRTGRCAGPATGSG